MLPEDREQAERIIGAELAPSWRAELGGLLALQAAATDAQARFGVWLIVERESRMVIGDIGFFGPPEHGSVEIGYSIVPDRRRQAYVTEAARALIAWAQNQDGVERVRARCDPDNLASIRTLERLGFTRAGEVGGELGWQL